jgi:hypothetical protein
MSTIARALLVAVIAICCAAPAAAVAADAPLPEGKNWAPPPYKIYAQKLADQIMAEHPELISVTFHGVPPGLDKVYTMYAGSYPERIGNIDDPDDVMVDEKGITIIDPRWNRKDPIRKFVMMMPLRDRAGEHLGLLVLAYRNPEGSDKGEMDYFKTASDLRDKLQAQIPSYAALFARAN